jgi:hypothetical protein
MMNVNNVSNRSCGRDKKPEAEAVAPVRVELITKKELSRRVSRCAKVIERWQKEDKMPHLKHGKAVLYNWPIVLEFLERKFGRNYPVVLADGASSDQSSVISDQSSVIGNQ